MNYRYEVELSGCLDAQIEHIIIMGHSNCGGIRWLMFGPPMRRLSTSSSWGTQTAAASAR